MARLKVAYFGYDFFYKCLEHLCLVDNVDVGAVFTFETDDYYNFNSYIKKLVKEYSIELKETKITSKEIDKLVDEGYDLIISAGYPYKIPINANIKGINIHPTLLPDGKGPWPLPYIILNNQKQSGVSIHKLEDELDSGSILINKSFDVRDDEDLETLSIKSQLIALELIEKLFENFEDYYQNAKPQTRKGTYLEFPKEKQMSIFWDMDVDEISKVYRAFGNMDCCFILENKHWLTNNLVCWKEKHNYTNGYVVHKTNKELLIAVRDGYVCIKFYKRDSDYE